MTIRKQFATTIVGINQYIWNITIVVIIAMFLSAFYGAYLLYSVSQGMNDYSEIIQYLGIPFQLYFMFCLYKIISTIYKELRCPNCQKNISYLVTSYDYTKKIVIFGLPKTISDEIKECPYCKVSLDDEINL